MTGPSVGTTPAEFDPVRVVLEYVGHVDVARRFSAAVALRTIGTMDAAVHLARMALAEKHRPDRERIVQELTSLLRTLAAKQSPTADVWTALLSGTRSDEREERLRAFDVILSMYEVGALEQSDRAVAAIVDAAVGEGTPSREGSGNSLMKRAEDALVMLGVQHHDRIAAAAAELAEGPRRPYVTLLFGRLVRRGFPVRPLASRLVRATRAGSPRRRWWRWWDRISAAWEVADAHDLPSLPTRFLQKSVVVPSLIAAFIGAALVAMSVAAFAARSTLPSLAVFYPLLVLVSVMIAMVLSMAATSRSTPFFVHHDLRAATVAAIVRAVAFTSIVGAMLVLILMLAWRVPASESFTIGAVIVVVAAMVRVGTIVGFLAIRAGVWKGARLWWWPTQLLAILAGSGAGLAVLFALRKAGMHEASDAMLIFLAPSTGAIATAFAVLDRPAPFTKQMPSTRFRIRLGPASAASVLAGVAVVGILMPIVQMTERTVKEPFPLAQEKETRESRAIIVDPHRAEIQFGVAFPQEVVLQPTAPRAGDRITLFYKEPLGATPTGEPRCAAEAPDMLVGSGRQGKFKLLWGCFKGVLQRAESNESLTAAIVLAVLRARTGIASDGIQALLNAMEAPDSITDVRAGQYYTLPSGASNWLLRDGTLLFNVDPPAALLQLEGVAPNVASSVVQVLPQGKCISLLHIESVRPPVESDFLLSLVLPSAAAAESKSVVVEPGRNYRLIMSRSDDQQAREECAKNDSTSRNEPVAGTGGTRPSSGITITRSRLLQSGDTIPSSGSADGFAGAWVFTETPFSARFTLVEDASVQIRIPRQNVDLTLELVEMSGGKQRAIASADDPEVINKRLGPGSYQVQVQSLGDNNNVSAGVEIRVVRGERR